MPATADSIVDLYRSRTPNSERLAKRAQQVFPSGITHDARYLQPYPLFVERAAGSRKWDVDGNEYVDYFGGHGSLLLGHNDPQVTAAVAAQLERGTHYGACHELELRWGEAVKRLLPSVERIRFTNSGTEATLLAMRLSRAFTGKPKVLRFLTNFHGWQDHVAFGVTSHHDGTPTPGVLPEVAENTLLAPPGDLDALNSLLAQRDDVAAVILEPTGGSAGQVPVPESFLHGVREATADRDVLLICDEVITGFRCSPGGMQGVCGMTPDLTTMAKILAGGFPGGAVGGRRDVLELLDHAASTDAGREKIAHQGTFNANPISAAAGVTALGIVAETDACERANRYAARLREGLANIVREEGLPWVVYGTFSSFHIFTNPERDDISAEQIEAGRYDWRRIKAASASPTSKQLRLGMLTRGVDCAGWPGGLTSAVHTPDDLDATLTAFREVARIVSPNEPEA